MRELSSSQLLGDLLPARVGSPRSLNSLREVLDDSNKALTPWVEVLDRRCFVFRVRSFATRLVQSLREMSSSTSATQAW